MHLIPLATLVMATMLAVPGLSAQTAFDQAPRTADGRLIVDNLIIGCTTHVPSQEKITRKYRPAGTHEHHPKTWVSYDLDPEIHPDIVAPVQQMEQHIAKVNKKVYVEHFNDVGGKPLCSSYQGQLVRKLHGLMEKGAVLFMDFYLSSSLIPEDGGDPSDYRDFRNHPYGMGQVGGVNPSDNPFWWQATIPHFVEAVQPGSAFDTFQGRRKVLEFIVQEMKQSAPFMAGLPAHLGEEAQAHYLLDAASQNLDRLLEAKIAADLEDFMKIFYEAGLEAPILAFFQRAGFTDARLVALKKNPFNNRAGEKLIMATRTEPAKHDEASGSGAGAGAQKNLGCSFL